METTEPEDPAYLRFVELCSDLNLDNSTRENTWLTFSTIREKYTLEGDPSHWLCCAVYVACRQATIPSVGSQMFHGSYVNLTRLLRTSRLSLVEFFEKSRKWGDMTNLNQEFRNKIERLERNFAVTTVIYKKFEPIFAGVFKDFTRRDPSDKNNKRRHLPKSAVDLFEFCWTLFLCVKSSLRISDDLVNSYHLLLACTDLVFHNVAQGGMKSLLAPRFAGLTDGDMDGSQGEGPCIIHELCDLYDGISLEAQTIKEFWLKPKIKNMLEQGILIGDPETLSGLIEDSVFEHNSKKLEKEYEEYVLTEGDYDERMYLSSDKHSEFGVESNNDEYLRSLERQPAIRTYTPVHELRHLIVSTPLTCKKVSGKDDPINSPVTLATQCVSRLQALLCGRTAEPSGQLKTLLEKCPPSAEKTLVDRIERLGTIFCNQYSVKTENAPGLHTEFSRFRCQLGQTLYYRILESILVSEAKLRNDKEISDIIEEDMFQTSLFACCLEIVLYSYSSQRRFPWVLEIFGLPGYYFYKVIEVVIRAEDNLCREIVKHMSQVEEKVLEELVWKTDSPLWTALEEKGEPTPPCEDVLLPSQIDRKNDPEAEGPKRYAVIKTPSGEKCVPVTVGESNRSTLIIQDKTSSQILGVVLPSKHGDKPKIGNSIALFFRKFYHLAFVRLQDLCSNLGLGDEILKKIWTCLQQAIVNYLEELLKGRHIDQIIMCCVYVVSKVLGNEKSFTEIMRCYRLQPQSSSHVYRSVLLGENDERGDLIKFYNTIFIGRMQRHALRFSPRAEEPGIPLSPLPQTKAMPLSPCRKMSNNHSIFLRPLRGPKSPSPLKNIKYNFARSPTDTLKAINAMVQVAPNSKTKAAKRILVHDEEEEEATSKPSKIFAKRLQDFKEEVQEAEAQAEVQE